MANKKQLNIKLSEYELRAFNNLKRKVKIDLGIDISTSDYIRHCLKMARNTEFLYQINYISMNSFMSKALFKNDNKYPRAKNLK